MKALRGRVLCSVYVVYDPGHQAWAGHLLAYCNTFKEYIVTNYSTRGGGGEGYHLGSAFIGSELFA